VGVDPRASAAASAFSLVQTTLTTAVCSASTPRYALKHLQTASPRVAGSTSMPWVGSTTVHNYLPPFPSCFLPNTSPRSPTRSFLQRPCRVRCNGVDPEGTPTGPNQPSSRPLPRSLSKRGPRSPSRPPQALNTQCTSVRPLPLLGQLVALVQRSALCV
jgi:hypothetical protein